MVHYRRNELPSRFMMFFYELCRFQDPGISSTAAPGEYPPLDHGTELDIWIKRPDGSYGVGEVDTLISWCPACA